MQKNCKNIKQLNIVLLTMVIFVSCAFIFIAGSYFKNPPEHRGFTPQDFAVELPKSNWTHPIKIRKYEMTWLNDYFEMQSLLWNIPMSFEYIETEYLGRYFITAYCPEECGGSWTTSTGITCHYSDDWRTPTTCAIDPKVRKYGELIMVGDPESSNKKIYSCEDCGPGVRGQWVDCFVVTMDEVRSWPTGYKPVYSVKFKTRTLEGSLYKTKKICADVLADMLMPQEPDYYEFD